jgi:two-component system chemotaxis response regulator CheV
MTASDASLLANIDARTKLAGSNKMEILLFTLGTREIFGINVFKVREVSQTPEITKTPNMPMGVQGVISLRGNIIPVIALDKFIGRSKPDNVYASMIVTEFNKSTQAFLVDSVDRIIRVDWNKVRAPENIGAAGAGGCCAAAGAAFGAAGTNGSAFGTASGLAAFDSVATGSFSASSAARAP